MGTPAEGCLESLPPELRQKLREARLAKGLGFKRLARRAGVDRAHLSRVERGLRMPSVAVAELVAKALELDAATTAWLVYEAKADVGRSGKLARRGSRLARTGPGARLS
jgi:transcriptional regulator with XRE-family HTH domain